MRAIGFVKCLTADITSGNSRNGQKEREKEVEYSTGGIDSCPFPSGYY